MSDEELEAYLAERSGEIIDTANARLNAGRSSMPIMVDDVLVLVLASQRFREFLRERGARAGA